MTRRFIATIACAVAMGLAAPVVAQDATRDVRTQPTSDAGRPGGPLTPPGKIPPLSGKGLTPLSPNHLGPAVDGMDRSFQTAPGYLPLGKPPGTQAGERLPNSSVLAVLPPASDGRQGLPPQTWALLSARQQELHQQAQTAAMSSPLGEGFIWTDAGRQGEVRVVADRMFNNRPCRDFAHVVLIDGQRVEGSTTVCR
ncbi:MAG: hypothetical protein JNK21_02510 [Rhodospirillaceae bacterium]|nr:hypothetical protein [Rhodospirillaceae bacterium]